MSWTYSYNGIPNQHYIFATYCHADKFITLSFDYDKYIYLCGKQKMELFQNCFDQIFGSLEHMSWFSGFKYSKIVYDIWWNRILIPVGTDEASGQSYAISIYFDTEEGVETIPSDHFIYDNKVSYYDLQGRKVELNSSKGQIIIKTDGKKTVKIINH